MYLSYQKTKSTQISDIYNIYHKSQKVQGGKYISLSASIHAGKDSLYSLTSKCDNEAV
jgi:hypothetical protein